jgi:hypothetical protein
VFDFSFGRLAAMPRDGAITLTDLQAFLHCQRALRLARALCPARLIAERGDPTVRGQ